MENIKREYTSYFTSRNYDKIFPFSQAFEINARDDGHHSYLFISLFVLLGIWGFFMVERIIKITVTHQALKVGVKSFCGDIQVSERILCIRMHDGTSWWFHLFILFTCSFFLFFMYF